MNNRRAFERLQKEYHIEYGPFSSMVDQDILKASVLKNLSAGGILFCSQEQHTVGSQIFLKIHVPGWKQNDDRIEKETKEGSEMLLKVIAEVLHVDSDTKNNCFWIGAKFLGQVHN